MSTTSGTAITETAPTTVRTTASTTLTRIRSRLLALLLVAGAIVGLSVATAASASAAIAPSTNFHTECGASAVTAVAPDMRYYPNNAVAWSPRLYIWTSYGWQSYRTGATQAALGDNMNSNPWTITGSWMPTSWTFYGLPHNAYYQVRMTYGWIGANSAGLVGKDVFFPHQVAQGNFTYASYSRSTSSYCYIP